MSVSCWSSLASRAAVPIPRPVQNPCSASWYVIAAMIWWFIWLATDFQRTLTSPIPQNSLFPFGIKTTVCHMHSFKSIPSRNTAGMMAKTFSQLVASGESSRVAEISHWQRCSVHIFEGSPKRFRQNLRTAQAISSSYGISSSTRKRISPTGIGSPGNGTCW